MNPRPKMVNQHTLLDIHDDQRRLYGTIAYVRGLEAHPYQDVVPVVHTIEGALAATGTMAAPDHESTSEEEEAYHRAANTDDTGDSLYVPQ